jgi:hypothetical protein
MQYQEKRIGMWLFSFQHIPASGNRIAMEKFDRSRKKILFPPVTAKRIPSGGSTDIQK